MITQLKFGDFSSKDHFVVNKVIRPFYDIETELIGTKNKKLVSRNHKEKTIQVEITLINQTGKYSSEEINEIRDIICREIAIKNTEKLIFSDQPNRYWNATLDGNSDIELINRITGKAVLNFLVPDGIAHESTLTPVTAIPNSENILSMDIDYEGTEETPLTLYFHNNSETGYLAAIGMQDDENTFLTQLGYVDEADGEIREKVQVIYPKDGGIFTNWKDAPVFHENPNKAVTGSMPTITAYGGWQGGVPQGTPNPQNKTWYGTCKEIILPTAIENPYLWGRAWFETGKMGQTGQWTLAFVDENNVFVAGFAITKSDKVGNEAYVHFLGNDGKGTAVYKSIKFTPSYWLPPNPYGSQSRIKDRNMFDIRKEGSRIRYFFDGKYYPFTIPYLKDKKVKKVQFYTGQYAGRNTSQLVTHMRLRDVTIVDLKSQYWQDVPNRFGENTYVTITKENGMHVIYRDGIRTLEDLITGSDFPVLKPGKNHIEFMYSDFTKKPPVITGLYEKRWQ